MDLISYETIRAAHRAEKENELQKLPENLFENVRNWFDRKSAQSDTTTLLELKNARNLVEDIINRRERKIVMAAIRTTRGELPPRNLTPGEQEFFDETVKILKSFRDTMKDKIIGYEDVARDLESAKEIINNLNTNIKILQDLPQFVGTNMKNYGPFKIGDEIKLPNDVANMLIGKEVAKAI